MLPAARMYSSSPRVSYATWLRFGYSFAQTANWWCTGEAPFRKTITSSR